MYTVEESIARIKEDIADKEEQIELLNSYANGKMDFTENNFHKLCETCLRGTPELGKQFEKIFPFLKLIDKKSFINEYVFTLKMYDENFTVKIPCSALKNITIIIPKPSTAYLTDVEIESNQKELDKINKAINEKSVIKRADFIAANYKESIRLIVYLIKYRKKNYIRRLTEIKTELENKANFFDRKTKENDELIKKYNDTMEYFKNNFLTPFLSWSDKVIIRSCDSYVSYGNDIVINK